jgi:hypothetical protein
LSSADFWAFEVMPINCRNKVIQIFSSLIVGWKLWLARIATNHGFSVHQIHVLHLSRLFTIARLSWVYPEAVIMRGDDNNMSP